MKIVAKTSALKPCTCGWQPPVAVSVVPTGFLKTFLGTATAKTLKESLDAVEVACPSCNTVQRYTEVDIVK